MGNQVSTNGATGCVAPASFAEAPASATVKVTTPGGYDLMITFRATKVSDLLSQAQVVEGWLISHNFTPALTRPTGKPAQADAPTCPEHGKAMQRGKYGWFCPVKVGEHPQTGKALYCQHSVKDGQS